MVTVNRHFRTAFLPAVAALVLLAAGSVPSMAQVPQTTDADADTAAVEQIIKHPSALALSGAVSFVTPLHIIKEGAYDIIDLSSNGLGFDVGLRWYALDSLALSFHGFTGSVGFDDSHPGQMDQINRRLTGEFTTDSKFAFTGLSFGLQAYLGQKFMPDSRFNPYMKADIVYLDWELQEEDGGDVLVYNQNALEGQHMGAGAGLGTEYRLSDKIDLEFEWMWNYILTEDTDTWNEDSFWTNTHLWTLSAGIVLKL